MYNIYYIETIIFNKYEGEFSPLTIHCTSILYTSELSSAVTNIQASHTFIYIYIYINSTALDLDRLSESRIHSQNNISSVPFVHNGNKRYPTESWIIEFYLVFTFLTFLPAECRPRL